MGWSISYQLHRPEILSAAEVQQLKQHVQAHNDPPRDWESYDLQYAVAARPDNVIAWGCTKISFSDNEMDRQRLIDALTILRTLFPQTQCFVACDFESIGWDTQNGCYSDVAGEPDPMIEYIIYEENTPSCLD